MKKQHYGTFATKRLLTRQEELRRFFDEMTSLAEDFGVEPIFTSKHNNHDGCGEFHTWDFFILDVKEDD